MTYKNAFISLTMILIAGIAVWTTILSSLPQNTVIAKVSLLPDAIMEDVSATIMSKQGKPDMKIVTAKMAHFVNEDTTDLIKPELTIFRKSPKPWFISAKHAKATHGIDNIHFQEDVTIHHPADANNPATVIKTPSLLVHPNQQIAETNDVITLIQPNTIIHSTGMHADLNNGDIRLLSEARGEYVPGS